MCRQLIISLTSSLQHFNYCLPQTLKVPYSQFHQNAILSTHQVCLCSSCSFPRHYCRRSFPSYFSSNFTLNRVLTIIQYNGVDQDCCWNNLAACVNQHGQFGQNPCAKQSYQEDFCERFGVNCVSLPIM